MEKVDGYITRREVILIKLRRLWRERSYDKKGGMKG
jgi:hypothetical protein